MPQNNKTEVQNRRLNVSTLYLQSKTQHEIATILGISQGQVSGDLKALRKEWQAERVQTIDKKMAEELAKIDNLEKHYWDAWAKSCKDHKRTSQKIRGLASEKEPSHMEKTEEYIIKDGDPRFLQGVNKCIEQRCKLLGLDAPLKVEQQDNSFLHFLMITE